VCSSDLLLLLDIAGQGRPGRCRAALPVVITGTLALAAVVYAVTAGIAAAGYASLLRQGLALAAENLRTDPPVPVRFPPGDIGGPSGGLMLTLQVVDDFLPGDLTGGRVVGGSGSIGPGGEIGAVGGIDKKIAAAAGAGATVFLVSGEDYVEALSAAARQGLDDLIVIPVDSLEEAYQALVSLTGLKTAGYNGADLPPDEAGPVARLAVGR